jgi:hypothetical protein
MEKTITIDGKQITFKSNGATPLRYKAQFGNDFFKEVMKLAPLQHLKKKKKEDITAEDLESLDFEVFYNISWVLAKAANPEIPEPLEWLEEFEEFPMIEIIPELQDMMLATLATKKKKIPRNKRAAANK